MIAIDHSVATEDIAVLCDELSITTTEEAITIFEHYYPEDPLPKYAKPLLQEALGQ